MSLDTDLNTEQIPQSCEPEIAENQSELPIDDFSENPPCDTADTIEELKSQIACLSSEILSVKDFIKEKSELVEDKIERQDKKLMQTLRENANFQVQVRQGMQKDIDAYKKQVRGDFLLPILREIANIYIDNIYVLNDEGIPERTKNNLSSMFEQLEECLNEYGAEIVQSKVGTVRKLQTTKVISKVATGEREKHNTIALSRRPGIVKDNSVLVHEFVDIFVFDESLVPQQSED